MSAVPFLLNAAVVLVPGRLARMDRYPRSIYTVEVPEHVNDLVGMLRVEGNELADSGHMGRLTLFVGRVTVFAVEGEVDVDRGGC